MCGNVFAPHPTPSPKREGQRVEIFRHSRTPVAGGGEAVIGRTSVQQGLLRDVLPRYVVNRCQVNASVRRDAPVILDTSAIGPADRCAQQKYLRPDQRPDDRQMRRKTRRRLEERHAPSIHPDTEVSENFIFAPVFSAG